MCLTLDHLQYTRTRQATGLFVLLDHCKAFERVQHSYFFAVLALVFRTSPSTFFAISTDTCGVRTIWLVVKLHSYPLNAAYDWVVHSRRCCSNYRLSHFFLLSVVTLA